MDGIYGYRYGFRNHSDYSNSVFLSFQHFAGSLNLSIFVKILHDMIKITKLVIDPLLEVYENSYLKVILKVFQDCFLS